MKGIVIGMLAGLTTTAHAGLASNLQVHLTFDKTVLNIGESAVASIWAEWDGVPGSYFSSIAIDLQPVEEVALVSNLTTIPWNNPSLGFDGIAETTGYNILGIEASQLSLFPPVDTSRPLPILSFSVTAERTGWIDFNANETAGAFFAFSVTGPGFNDPTIRFELDSLAVQPIQIVPTQASFALLGLAGMALINKRNRK